MPVSVDARIYVVALALALISGFLFGIVPVRQVLRANPYEVVKAGAMGAGGRKITVRDILLVAQIAICGVLVTASMVAVRGLMRSVQSSYGFEPHDAMLASINLAMAGYKGDAVTAMQKRMIEAMETIPGVEAVGMVNNYAPLVYAASSRTNIFKEQTTDLRPANAAIRPYRYEVFPGYFQAAGTALLAGRDFTWHDEKTAPAVAIANREFARRMFGSVENAVGSNFKLQDGTLVKIVGIAEDGKYMSLTEDQQPAVFLAALRSPANQSHLVVRSHGDPQRCGDGDAEQAARTRSRAACRHPDVGHNA